MNFMRGRYGWDQLGMFLMIASFVVEILGRILRVRLIYCVGLGMFIWMFYRMLSRNIAARAGENQRYIALRNRFANWRYFRQGRNGKAGNGGNYGGGGNRGNVYQGDFTYEQQAKRNRRAQKKGEPVYCYYYCPSCKQQVRVPAGKGKVRVTCPRCGEKFETYS